MSIKQANVPKQHELTSFNIKEIIDKYPDKVVSVESRNNSTCLIMDTCILIFNSNFPRANSITIKKHKRSKQCMK